jgi:hypothetical protein
VPIGEIDSYYGARYHFVRNYNAAGLTPLELSEIDLKRQIRLMLGFKKAESRPNMIEIAYNAAVNGGIERPLRGWLGLEAWFKMLRIEAKRHPLRLAARYVVQC